MLLRRLLALGALGAARGACIGASSVGPCPAPPNASTLLWAFGAASTVSCACACASSQLCGWWTHDLANGTCRVQTARTADAADPAPGGASCASGPTARAATDDDRDDDSNASAAKPNILWVSHARAPRSPGRGYDAEPPSLSPTNTQLSTQRDTVVCVSRPRARARPAAGSG